MHWNAFVFLSLSFFCPGLFSSHSPFLLFFPRGLAQAGLSLPLPFLLRGPAQSALHLSLSRPSSPVRFPLFFSPSLPHRQAGPAHHVHPYLEPDSGSTPSSAAACRPYASVGPHIEAPLS
jgi:hypothetical protein